MTPTFDPFPHLVLTGLWDHDLLAAAHAEFDWAVAPTAWQTYDNQHELKRAARFASGGPACQVIGATLASPDWCQYLSDAFHIPGLTFDDLGGGLHWITEGGHLDMHVDFNQHPNGRHRRLNCLVYLNKETDPSGDLLLSWGYADAPDPVRIPAKANTTVIFETSDTSWHGHPTPLTGPDRRSLAAYYYTETAPETATWPHDTIFLNGGL